MEETVASPITPKSVREYKVAIAELLAEMAHLNDRMRHDQLEIDRFRRETLALKSETRALIAALGATE